MAKCEPDASNLTAGTVIRTYLGHYIVETATGTHNCRLSSKLRKQLTYPEANPGSRRRQVQSVRRLRVVDPVAIGDRVEIEPGGGETGMIMQVLPRHSKISRAASGGANKEQVLAANVDQAIPIMSAAEPGPDWNLLDRLLAISEWQEIAVSIVYNKMDLVDEDEAREQMTPYEKAGYPVLYTSAVTDVGKDGFRELLASRVSLLMGLSGVGKSSLVNWIQPGLKLRTAEVSEGTGEGRHTTTHMELVALPGGGLVGDIPGIREFGLWQIEPEDVAGLFPEFRERVVECQFRDCRHLHEPGCAVKRAVESGEVSRLRYESYLRICAKP